MEAEVKAKELVDKFFKPIDNTFHIDTYCQF